MTDDKSKIISDYMSEIASIKTERTTAARRANIAAHNARRTLKPCTCGRTDGSHAGTCPVYKRLYKKAERERKGE